MSNSPSRLHGHLLLLQQSDRWSSSIVRHANKARVAVRIFENVSQLATQLESFPNAVIFIELSERLQEDAASLQLIWQQASRRNLAVVAVGDFSTRDQRIELIQAGFAEAFSSTAETPRLLDLALRNLKQRQPSNLSIEKRVERDLPWSEDAV